MIFRGKKIIQKINKASKRKSVQKIFLTFYIALALNFFYFRFYSVQNWRYLYSLELIGILIVCISFIIYTPKAFQGVYTKHFKEKKYFKFSISLFSLTVVSILGSIVLIVSILEHTITLFSVPMSHKGHADLEMHGGRYRTLHLVFRTKNNNLETQLSRNQYYKLYDYFGSTKNLPVEINYLPKSYNKIVLSVKPRVK